MAFHPKNTSVISGAQLRHGFLTYPANAPVAYRFQLQTRSELQLAVIL